MFPARLAKSIVFVILAVVGLTACDSDSTEIMGPTPLPILNPGGTIPLGVTVQITASATYPLAPGGTSLTTICRGHVDVIIEYTPGSPVTNTCNATQGSSGQVNPVAGISSVIYQLMPGATADVTLNP